MDTAAAVSSMRSPRESSPPPADLDQQSQSSRSSFDSPQPAYDDIQQQQQHHHLAASRPGSRQGTDNTSSPAKHIIPASSGSNTLDSAIALVTLRHGTLSPVS